jgi:cystathionine gamma-synthase
MSTGTGISNDVVGIGTLALEHGGSIADTLVACASYGAPDAPAVLVLGGISADRHLLPAAHLPRSGWWPGVVGEQLAIDPLRFRLIGIDYIGGRGSSSRPGTGDRWPVVSTRDQAAAIAALLDRLHIDRLHGVVGASYGGMVALALAEQYGSRVERVVAICAAHRADPMASAARSVQRRIVRIAAAGGLPREGVAAARALAMTTYRSAAEFRERFGDAARVVNGAVQLAVDPYLDHHGSEYGESFTAESFLTLSQSLDLHVVDPHRIDSACTLICFDTDTLVPPHDVRALARKLPNGAKLTCVPTRFGHDGFLKEPQALGVAIAAALQAADSTGTSDTPSAGDDAAAPLTHYAARSERGTRRAQATAAVRAGVGSDTQHGAVIPPIQLSTTFTFEDLGSKRTYDYTRSGNPTRDLLAGAIAELEHGAAGIVTPTGMAAIAVTLQLLEPGDLLLAAHDGYGGTYRLIQALARKRAFDVEFVDFTRPDIASLIVARCPRMVWLETPSNPLLRITDIEAIAATAHAAGALCVADNTFLSPALQTPIDFGADIVVHSTTKYLNGHSDVVGGAVVARDVAVAEELGWWANCTGATGSPFDSYLTLRGIRTLHPRMRAHQENAAAVVDVLHAHPAVRAVHYPGLPSHRGHEVALRQQRGFGAMLSFELEGGESGIRTFVRHLQHFSLAESLGGVESLIAHPASMTHAAMDPDARRRAGISDALLRLSVGIEDTADLTGDLESALDRVRPIERPTRHEHTRRESSAERMAWQ